MILWLVLLTGVAAVPREAAARRYRVVRYVEEKGRLLMVFTFKDFFDARLERELKKGFQKVIVLRARVYRVGRRAPVVVALRTWRVVYDLWADSYRITVDDEAGTHQLRVNSLKEAIMRISRVRLSLGSLGNFPRGSLASGPVFYSDVIIQFAPLPKGFLKKIRRWLRNPQGPVSHGDSTLGTRFSLFVNPRISRALKELRFRTQRFYRR